MARLRLAAAPPFRLDLTVRVLQRLPSNPVEVWSGGRYLRAFETPRGPVAWEVRQPPGEDAVEIALHGDAGSTAPWRARVARALGAEVDLAPLERRLRPFPDAAAALRAVRGVKPPRFQALHEAFAGVVLFQQVSLAAALSMWRRLVEALSPPVEVGGVTLRPFPSAAALAACGEAELRGFGLSGAKARALRAVSAEIAAGELGEEALDALPSPALHERLLELPGVGPWSASLLALRGFGRLDRFPPGDAAAERLLRERGSRAAARALLDAAGDLRGMLYFVLLLERRLAAEPPAITGRGG